MRTEKEILKDFEKLGYKVIKTPEYIDLEFNNIYNLRITISLDERTYELALGLYLNMQEHKLLNELFKCWGWLDE